MSKDTSSILSDIDIALPLMVCHALQLRLYSHNTQHLLQLDAIIDDTYRFVNRHYITNLNNNDIFLCHCGPSTIH